MKRHISIFTFLLGTFVTAVLVPDANAGTQTISGGHCYFDGTYKESDVKYMSAPGNVTSAILSDGQQTTFTAHPAPGMKVANWKKWLGAYFPVTSWPSPAKTDNTYTLTGNSTEGPACLAVNFTYIPLTVKAGDTTVLDSGTINATNIKLPTPTKTGYTGKWKNGKDKPFNFGGTYSGTDFWYEDEKERNFYATLTADWTANTYTIVFNGNGATGGSMSDMSCTYDQPKSLPKNTFTKTYYTFAGWKDGNGTSYSDGASVKNLTEVNGGTVTLYAQWTKNSYTVTTKVADVSSGKGVTSPASATQGGDTSLTITAAPNDGYAFAQWDDGSTEATRMVTVVSNANYTATFTNRVYTMNFYLNQNSDETPWSSKQVSFQSPIGTLPTPVWEFHAFQGWFTDRVGGDQVVENSGSGTTMYKWITDLPLYAHWTEAKGHDITVEYDSERGTVTVEGTKVGGKFVENTKIVFTAEENDGYSFSHWEKGSSIFTENPLTNVVTESATYIAVFTGNVYKVTFLSLEGSPMQQEKFVTFGSAYGTLPTVNNVEDRMLDGWYTGLSGSGTKIEPATKVDQADDNRILFANWRDVPFYHIVFKGNGATNTPMEVQNAYCGKDVVLTSNQYARTGYTFNGWTNSTGTAYADGATVRDLAGTNETATLYAAWSPIPYTLAFDPQGGDFGQKLETQACIYDQEFLLRYTVGTRDLFDFGGWSNVWNGAVYLTKDLCKGKNAYDVPNGTNTLKAIWISRLTDYSRAMHCTNLVWDTGNKECWECIYDLLTPPNPSDSCVRGTQGQNANLSASLPGSGTLSFMWKSDKAGTSLIVTYGDSSTNLVASDIWQLSEIDVQLADAGSIPISLMLPYQDTDCYIAQMTWTPGGQEPSPTDAVTISPAAVSADGKSFSLSFEFNEEFDYLLKTNANLLSGNWGDMEIEGTKKGNILTFEPPILEGQPQMFYRVDTIQKK